MNKILTNRRLSSSKYSLTSLRKYLLLFQILAFIVVLSIYPEVDYSSRLVFAGFLILGSYLSSVILSRVSSGDQYILLIALMLLSIGSIMIYRLEPSLAIKQAIWLLVGIGGFFVTYFILRFVNGWEKWGLFYFIFIVGLFIVTILFGTVMGGAQNWIVIGGENGISIQPSEFIKILVAFLIAYHYTNYEKIVGKKLGEFPVGNYLLTLAIFLFIGFFFIQAELGTAILLYGLLIAIQFIYEPDKKQILINIGLALVGIVIAYILFDHIKVRFAIWMDPWNDIDNTGYQITQSLFAIAGGGFLGTGLGLGQPELIPRAYTDFIFSAICEEMGILAGVGVIMLFLILVYRGFKIALSQRDEYFSILAFSISISFALQALIIIGGVTKLIPLTGITIPFVTYGGSSILSSFISLGVLQYCSEDLRSEDNEWK